MSLKSRSFRVSTVAPIWRRSESKTTAALPRIDLTRSSLPWFNRDFGLTAAVSHA